MTTADLRITDDPRVVFEEIFRSLETHHPAKAEDVLDKLKRRFSLQECAAMAREI